MGARWALHAADVFMVSVKVKKKNKILLLCFKPTAAPILQPASFPAFNGLLSSSLRFVGYAVTGVLAG